MLKGAGSWSFSDVKRKDVEALIGTTADLSDSGVSTAVVQRNMDHILRGARSHHAATQNAAVDILAFTVNQGLFHPLQCLPILISLETSDDVAISERAVSLHATLHSKHSTLINVRFLAFAKASYDYQKSISAEVSGQRDGQALLNPWYSLISEKRAWRLDFVKALGKIFDHDLAGTAVVGILRVIGSQAEPTISRIFISSYTLRTTWRPSITCYTKRS